MISHKNPKFYNFVIYMVSNIAMIFLIGYGILKKEVVCIVSALGVISTNLYLMLKTFKKESICRNLSFKTKKILKIFFLIATFASSIFAMVWGIKGDKSCIAMGSGLLMQSISLFYDFKRNKNKQCKEESASAKLKN